MMQVLAVSRVMVAWQPIGIAMGVFDMCHRYQNDQEFRFHKSDLLMQIRLLERFFFNNYLNKVLAKVISLCYILFSHEKLNGIFTRFPALRDILNDLFSKTHKSSAGF